jgi:hypothetical protein
MGMSLALAFALVTEISAVTAFGQDNTNQSNTNSPRRRRGRRQPPPPPAATEQAAPEATPPATETMAPKKPARRRARRGGAMSMRGVPSGMKNCLDHLTQMAANDPLIEYEGHPSEIINNGLLWNDPKSKCSVGSDASLRLKVSNLATAWKMKDAARVRSLLDEIKSAAPQ